MSCCTFAKQVMFCVLTSSMTHNVFANFFAYICFLQLLELTGHQWPSLRYAILQPVTLSSATLMFLNDAIGSAIFPCCQHSSSLSQLPEKTSVVANDHIFSEIITRLPLLYSNHLTSLYGKQTQACCY
jgi:predicted ABC-type exoprotein transport system permease subunit